jgi:hypothetical protein
MKTGIPAVFSCIVVSLDSEMGLSARPSLLQKDCRGLRNREEVACDQAEEALPLPNAEERAHEAVSGLRVLSSDLRPSALRSAPPTETAPASAWTCRGRGWKPSRRDLSRHRRGLGAIPTMKQPALQAPGCWDAERRFGEGSLTAPLSAPTVESGFASRRPKRNGSNRFRERPHRSGARISTQLRGV